MFSVYFMIILDTYPHFILEASYVDISNSLFLKCILKPSSNPSHYIFTLIQKVKHRVFKICAFINEAILCRDSASYFIYKMTFTFCTDEVREKIPSFQKVTLFLRFEIFNRDTINLGFCLFEDVTAYRD